MDKNNQLQTCANGVTQEKLKIYKKYCGDIDNWAINGSKKEKISMEDDDWYLIDGFIQDFFLVKKGLTSFAFDENLNNKLKEKCDKEETIQTLKTLQITR